MIQAQNKSIPPLTNSSKKDLFKQDIIDLFLGVKSAHLSAHTFGYRGDLCEDFFKSPNEYYVINDEVDLINSSTKKIQRICQGLQNVVDLGPGGTDAVEKKTCPVLKAFPFTLENYIAIDVSKTYLENAKKVIQKNFKNINTEFIQDNFFNEQNLNINNKTLALLFGITLTNMPGIVDKKSGIEYLRKEMECFRSLLPSGAHFLCSFDTCQNEEKMMKAYNHPKHGKFIESIAYKIKEDLSLDDNFDETAWFYNPKWDAKNHMFRHIITSTKEMIFTIDNHTFHLPKGYDILSYMSVKFPADIYLTIFKESGFRLSTDPFIGAEGDVMMALLQA